MLTIRFFRVGKKNQPSFKIVVTDKRNPTRSGRFVEEVGFYNPKTKEKVLRKERFQYWISKGAQPSPTVYNLLIKEGILQGKKIAVHKKPKKPAPLSAETSAKAGAEATAGKPAGPTVEPAKAAPEGGEPRPESSGREAPKAEEAVKPEK